MTKNNPCKLCISNIKIEFWRRFCGRKSKLNLQLVGVSKWGKSRDFEGGMTGRKRNFVQTRKISHFAPDFPPNGTRTGHRVLDFFVRLCYDYCIKFGEKAGCGTETAGFWSVGACSVSGSLCFGDVRHRDLLLFRGHFCGKWRVCPGRSFAPPLVQRSVPYGCGRRTVSHGRWGISRYDCVFCGIPHLYIIMIA